jgi:hypothetical protein
MGIINYNNCHKLFREEGFEEEDTHIFSSGIIIKTYIKGDIQISFYQDNITKSCEFAISKGERELVFIGKLLSENFFKELIKSIDYEHII